MPGLNKEMPRPSSALLPELPPENEDEMEESLKMSPFYARNLNEEERKELLKTIHERYDEKWKDLDRNNKKEKNKKMDA